MIDNNEIRLLGQPIKITLPGDAGTAYKAGGFDTQNHPMLIAGETHSGYIMFELDDLMSNSVRELYLDIGNVLYRFSDWYVPNIYPLNKHICKAQQFVSFERIHGMFMLIYNKLCKLEEELYNKVDRE